MSHDSGSQTPANATQPDDPEPTSTWFVAMAGTVVFVALVYALAAFFFQAQDTMVREIQIDAPFQAFSEAKQKQSELLAQFVKYDEKTPDGKVTERIRITIDRAMDLVSAELASRPQAAAGGSGEARASNHAGAQAK